MLKTGMEKRNASDASNTKRRFIVQLQQKPTNS